MEKERLLYKYYLFLLVVLCTWISTVSAPPTPIRLLFLIALIGPTFNNNQFVVPVLSQNDIIAYINISGYRNTLDKSKTRSDVENRFIQNAKITLIDRYGMSEGQAHRYMQKKSMETGKRLIDIAKIILN